jgi:large subunit ribosomal protein L5
MATTTKEQKKSAKPGKGGGAAKKEAAPRGPHAGAGLPVPPPRLKATYDATIREQLMKQLELKNPLEVPRVVKIVLNVGMGEAIKQPKVLDTVVE